MKDDQRLFYWLIVLVLGIGIALFAIPAKADTVLQERTIGQGGLICDTEKEVAEFIEKVEAGTSQQEAIQIIDGCGILVRPMALKVLLIDEVQTEKARYLIVRYEFLDVAAPPQYSIAARHLRGASL